MANSSEAHNCFDIHIGRNLLLASAVLATVVVLGAEVSSQLTNPDAQPQEVPTAPLPEPTPMAETLVPAEPNYPDGTAIFIESFGLLAGMGIVAHRVRRQTSKLQ